MNALGIIYPIHLFVQFAINRPHAPRTATLGDWGEAFLLSLTLGVFIILSANFFCDVAADEKGLYVSFFWKRYAVRWKDVIGIKPIFWVPRRAKVQIVFANSLTPFHRLYGILYGFSCKPGFIIHAGLRDRDEIIRLIREHVNTAVDKGTEG